MTLLMHLLVMSLVLMPSMSSLVLVLHGHLLPFTGLVKKMDQVVLRSKKVLLHSPLLSSVLKPCVPLLSFSSVAVMVVNWAVQEDLRLPLDYSLYSYGSSTSVFQLQRLTVLCKLPLPIVKLIIINYL